MNLADVLENDITDCDSGLCVSVWFQGCDFHCPHCHNTETWDFSKGYSVDKDDAVENIYSMLVADNIKRNLSILGGEPLHERNRKDCLYLIQKLRERLPLLTVYLWTGYTIEELNEENDSTIREILSSVNCLIEGRFIYNLRDTTLKLRGSSNQRIFRNVKGKLVQEK